MARVHVFGDESGDFKFGDPGGAGSSKYFLVSTETKMKPSYVHAAFQDVVSQVAISPKWHAQVWGASTVLGLQLADYCAWATARQRELGKTDYYDAIKDKVASEYIFF